MGVKKKEEKTQTFKKKWTSIDIARVKLNPEQAVLTCCDSITRQQVTMTAQCPSNAPDCGTVLALSSS
jgi:hypothetical protein